MLSGSVLLQQLIADAIDKGTPMWNAGQKGDCVRVYTLLCKQHAASDDRIRSALEAAAREKDTEERGWLLREAFDAILAEPSEAPDGSSVGCAICAQSDRQDAILLCDGCDNECHMHCLEPPLGAVPARAEAAVLEQRDSAPRGQTAFRAADLKNILSRSRRDLDRREDPPF